MMVRIFGLRSRQTHLEDCQEGPKLNFLSGSSHQPRLKLCHLDEQVDPHLDHDIDQNSDDAEHVVPGRAGQACARSGGPLRGCPAGSNPSEFSACSLGWKRNQFNLRHFSNPTVLLLVGCSEVFIKSPVCDVCNIRSKGVTCTQLGSDPCFRQMQKNYKCGRFKLISTDRHMCRHYPP